ncbi:MAG: hypothetical protein QXI52_07375 [Nitrososphaerota archaeon]
MVELREVLSVLAIFAFFLLMAMLVVVLADFMRGISRQLFIIPLLLSSIILYQS